MPSSPPIRVLVVDDEPDLCALTKSFLETSNGLEVTTADSVGVALNELSSREYDAIISDYQMPKEDGIQFLKRLRASGDKIPFILLTGRGREEIVIEALNSGADFYLQKGGNPTAQYRELEHKVREAVRRNRAERSLRENEARLTRAQVIGMSGCWEFRWDAHGGYVWGSEEAFSIFGIPKTSDSVIPQDRLEACIVDRERTTKALVDLIQLGKEYNLEYEIMPECGGPCKFIHSMAELIRDQEGAPIKVEGVIQDITARRDSELRVRRLNRELLAIKECGRALVKARSEQELLDEVCRVVCEMAGYRMAWIGMAQHDGTKAIIPVAWNGYGQDYITQIRATWGDDERGRGPTGMAIKSGKTVFIQDFANDPSTGPWREQAINNGYCSSIGLPLMDDGVAFGALMLYSDQINGFTEDELGLLEELASDLAFGIISLRAHVEKASAKKELHDIDARFRALFEATGVPTIVIDMETGRLMEVNPAASILYGYHKEEISSLEMRDLFAEADEASRALQNQDGFLPLCYQKRKDGSLFPAEITTKAFTFGGRPTMIGTSQDISERLKAETALRESEDHFHCIADNAFEGIAISVDGIVMDMNGALTESLGYAPQETIGMRLADFFTPDSQPILAEKLKMASTEAYRAKVFRKDGSVRVLRIKGKNIIWKGRAARLSSVQDITDNIEAEEALGENEKRYRLVVESTNEAIVVAQGGLLRFVNPAAMALFEASRKDLTTIPFMERIHLDDHAIMVDRQQKWARGGPQADRYIIRLLTEGTVVKWVEMNSVAIEWEGKPASLIFISDITERKQAEMTLVSTQARLREAHKMAHFGTWDLRTDDDTIAWSEELYRIFGMDQSHPLPSFNDLRTLYTPDSWETLNGALSRAIATGEPYSLELEIVRPDGEKRWTTVAGKVKYDDSGRVIHGTVQDITRRKHAEEELKQTNAYLQNLLDYANAPIIVWDPQLRITIFNHAFERLTGMEADSMRGKHIRALFPEESKEHSLALIEQTLTGQRWEVVEIPIQASDGGVRTVLWNSATIKSPQGEVVATIAQGQDITRRKHAEEELKQTNAYLQNLLDYANAPIIVWDPQLRITIFNHAFERLTNLKADEMIGEPLHFLFPKESMEHSLALIQQTLTGQRWEVVEIPIRTNGGEVRTVLWNSAAITATGGEVIATIAQGQDITERKMAEEALRQGQETLRLVVSSAPFPLLISDRDGTYIIDANERARSAFGLTVGATQMLSDIFSDESALRSVTEAMATKGFVDEMEVSLRTSAAEPRWAVISVRAMSYEGEQRLVLATYDVTERRQMEKALQIANTKLGILNSITRHDIINQMQVLAGYIELSKLKESDPGQMKYLAKMSKSADNVQKMVAFTKEYQDIGVKAPAWVSMGHHTSDAFAMLRPKDVTFRDDTDGIEVLADPLVEKVPYNLIDNSIRHGEKVANITLSAERRGDSILIVYADDGVGVSPEDHRRLFEKGFGKNTGFGLFLSHEILAITGISISEVGRHGEGVRFEMLVPPGAWRLAPGSSLKL